MAKKSTKTQAKPAAKTPKTKKPKATPQPKVSTPKNVKKLEVKMLPCDGVFNNEKIMLCDKGSGKIMPDLSKIKVATTPNLKKCMEKAGQLQYRKCSESEAQAAIKAKISETKTEIKTQDTNSSTTDIKASVEACFAQLTGKNAICDKTTKEAVKAESLSSATFDFTTTDSEFVNKCQTAILGLSTDFVTCASLELTSGEL